MPVTVVVSVRFLSAKRKTNKPVASTGGTAISGDVHAGAAGIVTRTQQPLIIHVHGGLPEPKPMQAYVDGEYCYPRPGESD